MIRLRRRSAYGLTRWHARAGFLGAWGRTRRAALWALARAALHYWRVTR